MRVRTMRRSSSSCVSPTPRCAPPPTRRPPPPCRSRCDQARVRRGSMYSSCASSTCVRASRVRARRRRCRGSAAAVDDPDLRPMSFSRLRTCAGERSSSKTISVRVVLARRAAGSPRPSLCRRTSPASGALRLREQRRDDGRAGALDQLRQLFEMLFGDGLVSSGRISPTAMTFSMWCRDNYTADEDADLRRVLVQVAAELELVTSVQCVTLRRAAAERAIRPGRHAPSYDSRPCTSSTRCFSTSYSSWPCRTFCSRRAAREVPGELSGAAGLLQASRPEEHDLWIHAVSVGETLAAQPVVDEILRAAARRPRSSSPPRRSPDRRRRGGSIPTRR